MPKVLTLHFIGAKNSSVRDYLFVQILETDIGYSHSSTELPGSGKTATGVHNN